MAEESVSNQQQQECHLIVEIQAPKGADFQALQSAAQEVLTERIGKRLTCVITPESAVFQCL
jgi:hypothetical protein